MELVIVGLIIFLLLCLLTETLMMRNQFKAFNQLKDEFDDIQLRIEAFDSYVTKIHNASKDIANNFIQLVESISQADCKDNEDYKIVEMFQSGESYIDLNRKMSKEKRFPKDLNKQFIFLEDTMDLERDE